MTEDTQEDMRDDVGIYYLHKGSSEICTGDCAVTTVALEEGARSRMCSPSDNGGIQRANAMPVPKGRKSRLYALLRTVREL